MVSLLAPLGSPYCFIRDTFQAIDVLIVHKTLAQILFTSLINMESAHF